MQDATINDRRAFRCGIPRRVTRGFTFIEIVLVLVVLAVVAAIAVPKFAHAAQMARENTLKDDLRYLRTQIAVYIAQHKGLAPGCHAGTKPGAAIFVRQMTQYTDQTGDCSNVQSSVFRFGPYLTKMPPNALTGDASIIVISGNLPLHADNSSGWLYNAVTHELIVNSSGADAHDTPYSQY
jgi:general secretion pathway protein G